MNTHTGTRFDYAKLSLSALAALVGSLVFAYATVLILTLLFTDGLDSAFEKIDQVFARVFLAAAVTSLALIAVRWGIIQRFFELGRWARILTYAVGLGMATSILDPSSSIARENNIIRFWTSGLLIWAGVALVIAARTNPLPRYQKVAAFLLGVLMILAAADEILQFHEYIGDTMITDTPDALNVDSGDFVTLFVALVGFTGAVAGFAAIRLSERFFGMTLAADVRTSAMLFISACMVFLLAMMLDTYDHYLENFVNSVFAIFFEAGSPVLDFIEKHEFINRLANCIEEFLELTTAAILVCCGVALLPERRSAKAPA